MPRPKGSGSKSELVRLAIAGIDAEIRELMEKRAQFAKMAPGAVGAAPAASGPGRKRAAVTSSASTPAKKKRTVSAATRKKLKEAAKARWARVRGEKA
jgi:hypothetical protein